MNNLTVKSCQVILAGFNHGNIIIMAISTSQNSTGFATTEMLNALNGILAGNYKSRSLSVLVPLSSRPSRETNIMESVGGMMGEGLSPGNVSVYDVTTLSYLLPTLACLGSYFTKDNSKYEGAEILRIYSNSSMGFDLSRLMYLEQTYDFLNPPNVRYAEVLVCPEKKVALKYFLDTVNVEYQVLVPNLRREIDAEKVRNEAGLRQSKGTMTWDTYQRLNTIHTWMDELSSRYPDYVSTEVYGKSFEQRDLKVMKISKPAENKTKPVIWIDGGIHAREWISPATVSFIGKKLVEEVTRTDRSNEVLDTFEWHIMPSLNPDGYEYSHTNERYWRKTRSSNGAVADVMGCKGADPNRNWDYKWGGKGTSSFPCAEIFKGKNPASEPEVSSTQKYITSMKDRVKLFLTFHSYSQMIFTPWGYDNIEIEDKSELMAVANKAASTIAKMYGTTYETGSAPELLYPAAGGSEDWARGSAGIKFSYCFELRDKGNHGFILPPEQILESGEETYAGVMSMASDVKEYYNL